MKMLEERIRKDGIVREGNVLKVDSFINHQMDIPLFREMAKVFHAGTPVGNPLQDLMICTDDHFRSLIAPDIISVFFLFYTWLSQSQ